jgi:hypothetical protein
MQMPSNPGLDPDVMHLLVVVAQAARGEEMRERLAGLSGGRRLELRVIAPAYAGSMLEYVASDVDRGIERARGRLRTSLDEFGRGGIATSGGEIGEADPLMAIDDALVEFPADEIVIVPSPRRDQWAEKHLFEHVCRRFELPVTEIEIAASAA